LRTIGVGILLAGVLCLTGCSQAVKNPLHPSVKEPDSLSEQQSSAETPAESEGVQPESAWQSVPAQTAGEQPSPLTPAPQDDAHCDIADAAEGWSPSSDAASPSVGSEGTDAGEFPYVTLAPDAGEKEERFPLHYYITQKFDDSILLAYPTVYGRSTADAINEQILSHIQGCLAELTGPAMITCRVSYNSPRFFSLQIYVNYEDDSDVNYILPLTFDVEKAALCKLGDFFDANDSSWRGLLADMVTCAAKIQDLTLLCEVPPVEKNQYFYLDHGGLVLVYRPYEISTYREEPPQFPLNMEQLRPYLSDRFPTEEFDYEMDS